MQLIPKVCSDAIELLLVQYDHSCLSDEYILYTEAGHKTTLTLAVAVVYSTSNELLMGDSLLTQS